MSLHHFSLIDASRDLRQSDCSVAASAELNLTGSDRWSVRKHTLHGGLSEGVDVVELDNGRLSLSILPTRGMGIWRGVCDGLELGWKSPVAKPVHPAFVNLQDRGGIGWLAGFNEWICRCGLDSNGPPGPEGTLHGRIANLPAHSVEVSLNTAGTGSIAVTGVVDESTMFGPNLRLTSTVRTDAGSNSFVITDEITNRGGTPADLELLYHINTGRPFLEPGTRCVLPAIEVAPRDARAAEGIDTYDVFEAPAAEFAEQVYYFELAASENSRTTVLLHNIAGDKGITLQFSKQELPQFILWKNTRSEADGYVAGLEPATSFPNLKSFERRQGRVIRLAPGGKHTIRLEVEVHSTVEGVRQAEKAIAGIQKGTEPRIHRQPRAGWSPG